VFNVILCSLSDDDLKACLEYIRQDQVNQLTVERNTLKGLLYLGVTEKGGDLSVEEVFFKK